MTEEQQENGHDQLPIEWTQADVEALHKLAREAQFADQLKTVLGLWARRLAWALGLPASVLMVWEPVARLWKLLKGL